MSDRPIRIALRTLFSAAHLVCIKTSSSPVVYRPIDPVQKPDDPDVKFIMYGPISDSVSYAIDVTQEVDLIDNCGVDVMTKSGVTITLLFMVNRGISFKDLLHDEDLKDHVISTTVNHITETAIKYRDQQQLRERISRLIVPLLTQAPQTTIHVIPHTLAGYKAVFYAEHGRYPKEQEIWGGAIRSICDLYPSVKRQLDDAKKLF